MVNPEIFTLFDPEIVIPSPESAVQLEFWARLQEWTRDPRPRIGPKTSASLLTLLENPPAVKGLPMADFWTIVGKLVARVYSPAGNFSDYCDCHLREAYKPLLGAAGNFDLLADAISTAPRGSSTALATDRYCWTKTIPFSDCGSCARQAIALYFLPEDPLARVWRNHVRRFDPVNLNALQPISDKLFPELHFSVSAWNHLDTLSGDPREIVDNLLTHLGVLNDHVFSIWQSEVNTVDRQSHLARFGVVASPENANTRRSKIAMAARTFEFGGRSVRCEWHTKLHPGRDRVYFAVEDECVYIGAIIRHL